MEVTKSYLFLVFKLLYLLAMVHLKAIIYFLLEVLLRKFPFYNIEKWTFILFHKSVVFCFN